MNKKKVAILAAFYAYEAAIITCSYRAGYLHCKVDTGYKLMDSLKKGTISGEEANNIMDPIGFKKSFKNLVRSQVELFKYCKNKLKARKEKHEEAPEDKSNLSEAVYEKINEQSIVINNLDFDGDSVTVTPVEQKPEEKPEPKKEPDPKTVRTEYHKIISKKDREERLAEKEFPKEDVEVDEYPYQIDGDEFVTGCPNYEKIYLTYYIEDEVFADRNEEIVDNIETLLGYCPDTFYDLGASGDSVIYIRNDARLEDYEIMKVNLSYAKEVLGLG